MNPELVENAEPWPDDAVEVAVVTGAWGIRGGLRLKPHAADPQALFGSRRWYWKAPPRAAPAVQQALAALEQPLRVSAVKEQGASIVAQIHDMTDRTLAEACKGLRLFVRRSSFPSTDADEYYWVDLIGLQVVNRQGVVLGAVTGLMQTGPHSVLQIERAAGAKPPGAAAGAPASLPCLIPFVSAYVDAVDRDARTIRVDWDAED